MKQIFLAITIMLGLLLCGCAEDLESTTGGIAGSVSDKTTGEPVATANVTLSPGGASTVTGSDGSFSFQNLANGTYTISIAKEGYKSVEYGVYVRSGEQTSTHLPIERIPATITPDRDILDFGAESGVTTLSFAIVNKDYTNLDYTIEYDCPWIKSVKPNTGTLASGKTETIVVTIDRSQADKGDNTTVLVIKTSNGRAEITVKAVNEHQLPQLNVYDATHISSSSATLNGKITNSGTPSYTERGFVYSTSSNPTIETTIEKLTVPVSSTVIFSYSLSGLTLGKTYYVRAYAKNSVGVAYSSNQVSFTPKAVLPTLIINEATNVSSSSATLNGKITNSGTPSYTERGFVYSTSSNPTIETTIAKLTVPVSSTVTFSYPLSGLTHGKTYYARAYAKNVAGVAYSSNQISFTPKATLPTVTTEDASGVDFANGTASLNGTVVSSGEPGYTERGFVYSLVHNPTIYDNKIIANGTGVVGAYSVYATNLPKNKTYYVRAYATNLAGTSYGNEVEIKYDPEWIELPAIGIAVQTSDLGVADRSTAISMCKASRLGGYTDWRLPTISELLLLYNKREIIGGFKNSQSYWSSSDSFDYETKESEYYYVSFYDGMKKSTWTKSAEHYVRAVRTLTK